MFSIRDLKRAYAILGVKEGTPLELCKKEYRRLSLVYHPDRGGDSEKFHAITEAFECIKYAQQNKISIGVSKSTRVCKHRDLMHFYVES